VVGVALAIRFVIELACLAGLAFWGANASPSTVVSVVLAVATPLAAALAWGAWSAPKAPWRLRGGRLVALELGLLAIVCALLTSAGHLSLAVLLAVCALIDGVALKRRG
jgi:hypothetical protein